MIFNCILRKHLVFSHLLIAKSNIIKINNFFVSIIYLYALATLNGIELTIKNTKIDSPIFLVIDVVITFFFIECINTIKFSNAYLF